MKEEKTLAILPVKKLDRSKSRLSSLLSEKERGLFTLGLLRRTFNILKSSNLFDNVLIVSRDRSVEIFAEQKKALFLLEKRRGLNQALTQATRWAVLRGVHSIFILPLDVPFLTIKDIHSIIEMGKEKEKIVVIAPDRERIGTNALFIKPPGIIYYRFGNGSFQHHRQQLKERQIETKIYTSTGISFDVDSTSDYKTMLQMHSTGNHLCQRLQGGYPSSP